MHTSLDAHIQQLAESCVNSMGDIFWDFHEGCDAALDFVAPTQVAISCVASTLQTFAATCEPHLVYTSQLRLEYREMVGRLAENANENNNVVSLASEAAWTEEGARTVLRLARTYGMSVLRNALALAEALDIEDGDAGL